MFLALEFFSRCRQLHVCLGNMALVRLHLTHHQLSQQESGCQAVLIWQLEGCLPAQHRGAGKEA